MLWFVFLTLSLTAYRATRLLVKDSFPPVVALRDYIAGGPRKPTRAELYHPNYPNDLEPGYSKLVPGLRGVWYVGSDGGVLVHRSPASWSPHWLGELVTCPWCASAYISGALVAVTDVVHGLPVPWLTGPAVWALAALLSSREWA